MKIEGILFVIGEIPQRVLYAKHLSIFLIIWPNDCVFAVECHGVSMFLCQQGHVIYQVCLLPITQKTLRTDLHANFTRLASF